MRHAVFPLDWVPFIRTAQALRAHPKVHYSESAPQHDSESESLGAFIIMRVLGALIGERASQGALQAALELLPHFNVLPITMLFSLFLSLTVMSFHTSTNLPRCSCLSFHWHALPLTLMSFTTLSTKSSMVPVMPLPAVSFTSGRGGLATAK